MGWSEREYYENILVNNRVDEFGKFTSFEVIFHLMTPICISYPWLNLDSIIDHLMFAESMKREIFTTPKKINLSELAVQGKRPYGKLWDSQSKTAIPTISCGIFDREITYKTETIYKRFEDRFAPFGGKIRIGQGRFKAYMMKHIIVPARAVTFYVWGDMDYIRGLIERNLFAIGNDIRIGYGWIKKIEYHSTPERKNCVWENGKSLRAIPVEFCRSYRDAVPIPYRSPYWDSKNIRLCAVPFSECELK
jgi:CRISPR type IV-associated protein Csf3